MIEWDERKNAKNREKHGLAFEEADDFDFDSAIIVDRSRHADGEPRFAAIGFLHGKIHTMIYTRRHGRIRIISLRRANEMEERAYEENR